MNFYCYNSPIGRLAIGTDGESIAAVRLLQANETVFCGSESSLHRRAYQQLTEYFQGQRKSFELPLTYHGTTFREKVWAALLDIPWGSVRSYGEVARQIGQPNAARAVGGAVHNNDLLILIP